MNNDVLRHVLLTKLGFKLPISLFLKGVVKVEGFLELGLQSSFGAETRLHHKKPQRVVGVMVSRVVVIVRAIVLESRWKSEEWQWNR